MSEGPPPVPQNKDPNRKAESGGVTKAWMSPDRLRKELKAGYSTIINLAQELSDSNPEWIRGTKQKYYSPELIEVIKERLDAYPLPPSGWLTWPEAEENIPKYLKNTAKKWINGCRATRPELFQNYKSKVGRPITYLSPELVSELGTWVEQQLVSHPLVPEGWITRNNIAAELSTTHYSLEQAEEHLKNISEHSVKELTGPQGVQMYYSPEFVSRIREEIRKIPLPPEGWVTNGGAPEAPASKIVELQQEIDTAFTKVNKVAVFTNSYTQGVLVGDDSILQDLRVPDGITVETIYGGTPPEERERIQGEFQLGTGQTLLLVSGQTADVGVDYSNADYLVTYNEPWTEAARRQQLARAYRPGRTGPLTARTLIAKGTIEEGMHEYIQLKHKAIGKLLKGVPLSELEQDLLEENEREAEPDLEVSPELAKYYFSSLEKLNKIFAVVKESGEEKFRAFLEQYGEEYAACYQDLGNRSYQSNVSRVSSTLLEEMTASSPVSGALRILDIASGPEMLKRHALPAQAEGIVSVDLNGSHFKNGARSEAVVGSFTKLPFTDNSFRFANFALALHYTRFVPSRGVYERVEALREIERVLEPGGRAVITLIHSLDLKNPEGFRAAASALGLTLVDDYSGMASEGTGYEARVLTLEKTSGESKNLKEIIASLSKEQIDGLKLIRRDSKLKDSRRILSSFEEGGKTHDIRLNAADQKALTEERMTMAEMKALKASSGSIENISPDTLRERSMVRMHLGRHYILFKKLSQSGVVIEK